MEIEEALNKAIEDMQKKRQPYHRVIDLIDPDLLPKLDDLLKELLAQTNEQWE